MDAIIHYHKHDPADDAENPLDEDSEVKKQDGSLGHIDVDFIKCLCNIEKLIMD